MSFSQDLSEGFGGGFVATGGVGPEGGEPDHDVGIEMARKEEGGGGVLMSLLCKGRGDAGQESTRRGSQPTTKRIRAEGLAKKRYTTQTRAEI